MGPARSPGHSTTSLSPTEARCMTELHPDRLLDGGPAARSTAAPSPRTPAAAPPERRPTPAGKQRKAPQRRTGESSPTGGRRPGARPRPTPHPRSGTPAAALEVRAVLTGDPAATAPADVAGEVLAAEPVTAVADAVELAQAADAQALAAVVPAATDAAAGDAAAGDAAAGDDAGDPPVPGSRRRHLVRGVRPPRRRPTFYLAAALVGAVGVGTTTAGDRVAQASAPEPVSASVSVAEELGVDGQDLSAAAEAAGLRSDAVALLSEVTASRTAREAETAAAAQVQAEADRVAAEAAAAAAAEAARPEAVLPVAGGRLTSTFGPRWGSLHAGIDLAAPMLTPEYAAADGVVLEAGPAGGYGNVVYVQHDNGDVTVYGHMEEILVTPGQVVRAGDTIALLGNRGQSTGPHLHFEVHVGGIDGQKVDPIPWLRERGVAV